MSKKALIVDDSKTARLFLQKMLHAHDLVVDNAASAEDALTYLSENRPDIIFMDHQMPGMDGFEAVSAIKKNPATATIPIMMYTAQEGELYVGQARALGAVGVLPKEVEPVELSKVLESLRVIGEDAKSREHIDDPDAEYTSGEYPGLEKFDQDLGFLIQELFDQQRAILRRDLRASHETIAARVADEIRSPEKSDAGGPAAWIDRYLPGVSQGVVVALTAVVFIFGVLYWQSRQASQNLQEENVRLLAELDEQQALETQDAFQARQQLSEYRAALDSTYAVALDTLEWASNQSAMYGFDEEPLGDYRLTVLAELSTHLASLDFRGLVRVESHVGNFCMSSAGAGDYVLPPEDMLATQCDRIGYEPGEAYERGLRQSVAFANFINLADERTGGRIRYEVISLGNLNPLMPYPASVDGVSVAVWNEIAANNNRVDISIYPDGSAE